MNHLIQADYSFPEVNNGRGHTSRCSALFSNYAEARSYYEAAVRARHTTRVRWERVSTGAVLQEWEA